MQKVIGSNTTNHNLIFKHDLSYCVYSFKNHFDVFYVCDVIDAIFFDDVQQISCHIQKAFQILLSFCSEKMFCCGSVVLSRLRKLFRINHNYFRTILNLKTAMVIITSWIIFKLEKKTYCNVVKKIKIHKLVLYTMGKTNLIKTLLFYTKYKV